MGYSSPALTCVKASRRKSWRVSIRPVGQRRAISHDSSQWQAATEEAIIELAAQPEVVAIGECGLDFNRNFSTPEEQERAFVAQLRIAADLNMPVFMHCRDAHERFMTLLEPWLDKLPGAVLHCFTGTREEMQACVAHGIYIGITGWVCDERRGWSCGVFAVDSGGKITGSRSDGDCSPLRSRQSHHPGATSQPICPIFCNVLRTGVEKMPHGWLPPRMLMSNTVRDRVLEFAELGVLHCA